MPVFGYSEADLLRAREAGERAGVRRGRSEATDKSGRTADKVWELWCRKELISGSRPPLFCPDHVIDAVREELRRERAGI